MNNASSSMFHRASHWLFWTGSGRKSRLNANRRACAHVSDLAGMYFMSCAALIAIDFRWGSTLWNRVFDLRGWEEGRKGTEKRGKGDRCRGQERWRENLKQERRWTGKIKYKDQRKPQKRRACSAESLCECHVHVLTAIIMHHCGTLPPAQSKKNVFTACRL